MPETQLVKLTIDERTVQVAKGTTILRAAKSVGIDIPYYCYHPGLSIVGSCRMCLVEVEKIPKLQASCATPVAEGMVVRTQTPETLKNRKMVLEFLLLNHPLDCPVCDQAGECELQNYYMDHGAYDPRFNENKKKRKKAFPIGPHVILDQERCILCTRCVRFTREISKTGELCVHDRGHLSEIDIFPGAELNNPYSGNVVDICPVGALTDRDFRFQCRVWFLGSARSVCPGCSRGCNISIHFNERFNPRYHTKRVHRLKPRYNPDVNGHWMCDEGRYGYGAIDAADRLKEPSRCTADGRETIAWSEAIQETAAALRQTLGQHGPKAAALIASPAMTNEELYGLRLLFHEGLNLRNIGFRVIPRDPVFSDDFLITPDKNPNTRGAQLLGLELAGVETLLGSCARGEIRFLLVCHQDLMLGFDEARVRAALGAVEFVCYMGSHGQRTAALAHVQLPTAVYAEKEGTFTNVQGRVQKIHAAVPPLGDSMGELEILGRLAAALDVDFPRTGAAQVFDAITRAFEPFSGMTYETLGESGQLLKQG